MKKTLQIISILTFLFVLPTWVMAQQPITQFQQFNGRYEYLAIGNTLNASENGTGQPCTILTQSSATLNLSPNQTVEAAYLFWAGSSNTGDFQVALNGVPITASTTFSTDFSDPGLFHFGAFADVTAQVQTTGNGNYTFSDMDIAGDIISYCGNGTNFGGWSIVIVYEDANLPFNQVSVYIGFESVYDLNNLLQIQLQNLNVVSTVGAKIGFLAWEGDAGIANNESLSINGMVISNPPLNPVNNAFNGTNSFTGSTNLWNMDLDLYDIQNEVNVGDTTMDVVLTSNQDAVIVNNIVVVLANELPDATIVIDDVELTCDSRNIEVDYTVSNLNSTGLLLANTPIAFYANGNLVGTAVTIADIPIDGSESNTIILSIPAGIPDTFTLIAVVDDIGDGTGIIQELDENNNDFSLQVTLINNPVAGPVSTVIVCDLNNDGFATFFLPVAEIELLGTQTDITVTYYTSLADADLGINQIGNPEAYVNTSTPFETIYVRLQNDNNPCFITSSFDIEVRPVSFLPFALNDLEFCLDGPSDIGHPIDLTVQEATIFGGNNPADYTVTYHPTQLDAAAGINAFPDPTAYPNATNPEVIWVRLVNNVINCVEIGSFAVQIYLNPLVTDPANMTPYELCDDDIADGFTIFDLITKLPEIIGSNPNADTSFHASQSDADNDINPLPFTGYTNISNPQTIFVRVRDMNNDCVVYTNFDLVVNENPVLFQPDPLTYCDPDNDGFGIFTLTDADNQITGGVGGLDVTYYLTEADASNGVNPQPTSPFFNNVFYSQLLWVRVENSVTGCYSTTQLMLEVLDTPQLVVPDDLVSCDFNGNGTTVFDLTEVEPQMMANITNPSDFNIFYYANATDLANDDPIVVPTAYTNVVSPRQTIYVVVEDTANSCTAQVEFDLIVVDLPEVFPPTPLELCDVVTLNDELEEFDLSLATPEITGGDASLTVTYHLTQADADAGVSPLPNLYTNTVNNQTIYIRVENGDGCVISQGITLTLIVNPLPSPATPQPFEVCDPDSDGFSQFDLDILIPGILNGEPDVTITFHETLADAEDGIFALVSPYSNIVQDQQLIYVRAQNDLTGCYTIVELTLVVVPTPFIAVDLPDLEVCSQDQTATAVFDLTLQAGVIYGTQDPTNFTLTYHISQADAQNGVNAINNPASYTNTSSPQTIWVRLVHNSSGCTKVGSFLIVVNLPPSIAAPADLPALEACDDEVADGFTEFDLMEMNNAITLSQPGLEVQYYLSQADAQAGANQILPANSYTNTSNPQNLWVKVLDADTGCHSFTRITLRVLPNPSPQDPDPIELCDADNPGDGTEVFDLTIREAEIRNGEAGVSLSYHETLSDAEAGTNTIADPENYSNTSSPQTIYVRVENDVTGCYTIVELILIVNGIPDVATTIEDYIICEANTDGQALFDLTTKIPEILNGQDPAEFTVSFYEVEADAQAGQNAIPQADLTGFLNRTNPQEIFVRVENNDTECSVSTASFFLEVLEGAEAVAPLAALEDCEDELGTGIATFDLTQLDAGILSGQDPTVYVLTYHETLADAETGTNAITNPSSFQSSSQTIYARVTNTDTDCSEIAEIELQVNPIPDIDLEETYRLCVDGSGNPIPEESGAMSPPTLDTGLSSPQYSFVWELDGTILTGETQGTLTALQGGTYTVTVTNTATDCQNTASTTVTVSSPPLTYSAQVVTAAFAGSHAIQASAEGSGSYLFSIDNGPFQSSGLFENVSPGTHTITITDANGCGTVQLQVGVIDYPLFFTPNGDGYHDTWNIIGIASIPSAKIYIFDRYGKLLKQLSPTGAGWDGTFNGRPVPSSDYWFQVIYTEEDIQKEFKGHFTLKR